MGLSAEPAGADIKELWERGRLISSDGSGLTAKLEPHDVVLVELRGAGRI